MSTRNTIFLPAGFGLTITSAVNSTGSYRRLDQPGGQIYNPVAVAANTTVDIGPFDEGRMYEIVSNNKELTTTQTFKGYQAYSDEAASPLVTNNIGTAATGVTALEYGDAYQHTTILAVDTTLPAIAGGANLAVGKLLYTLPAGACIISNAHMNLAIQQTEDNITADTPDGGIGTTIGSGTVAVLGGTTAFENIITGQTFNDCDGTAEVLTVAGIDLVIAAAAAHTIHFNVAANWTAGGDAAAALTGTVVLNWHFIA